MGPTLHHSALLSPFLPTQYTGVPVVRHTHLASNTNIPHGQKQRQESPCAASGGECAEMEPPPGVCPCPPLRPRLSHLSPQVLPRLRPCPLCSSNVDAGCGIPCLCSSHGIPYEALQ